MKKWLQNLKLDKKYLKLLDHLDNDQKVEVISKKYTKIDNLLNIFTYYDHEINDTSCDFKIRKAVLKRRNKDSYFIFEYAMRIIKDRWIEAEPYLLKNLEEFPRYGEHMDACIAYRKIFIKTRWKELEKVLCKDTRMRYFQPNKGTRYGLSKYVESFQDQDMNDLYQTILNENNLEE